MNAAWIVVALVVGLVAGIILSSLCHMAAWQDEDHQRGPGDRRR